MKKFCWSTLNVRDMEETLKFYEEIVGLEVVNRFEVGPDMEIAFLGHGETQIEFIWDKNNKEINIGSDISWGFEVESLDKMMELLKEKAIDIESGPFEPNPNTKFFFVKDPNGLRIQFVEANNV